MDMLFAIGQIIAVVALAYGAALCLKWRNYSDDTQNRLSRPQANARASHSSSSRDYVAAAETDPAS